MEISKLKYSLAEDYWLDKLSNIDSTTSFNKESIAKANSGLECLELELPESLADKLREIENKSETTLFLLLTVSLAVLLSKYSENEKVITATTNFGSGDDEVLDTLLFFKFSFSHDQKLKDLLKESLAQLNEINVHKNYDFDGLRKKLEARGNGDYEYVTQFGLVFNRFNNISDLTDNIRNSFVVNSQNNQFTIRLRYCSSDYSESLARQFGGHFINTLVQIASSTERKVSEIDLLTQGEAANLMEQVNNTSTDYPADKTVVELFEQQVLSTPKATALVFNRVSLTYQKLNARVNQLAHYLRREYNIQADTLVGIDMVRSEWQIISILAVLKAGAGYVPVDPDFPVARKKFIISDAGVTFMLCDTHGLEEVSRYHQGEIFIPDLQWHEVEECPADNPEATHHPESLVYVMYTSGSTGNPKGVAVENRGVVRLVKNTNYTALSAESAVLQLSNYAFDGSVFDIYGALLNGGVLHVVEKSKVLSIKELGKYIEANGVNTMFITTALFNSLVDICPQVISSFKSIYFGGENASLSHVEEALKYASSKEVLVHVYGPTEGTTFSTFYNLKDFNGGDTVLPIGLPISNTRAYILGKDGQLLPPGVDGELCLAGDGLARGYWGAGSLAANAEKFISGKGILSNERLYRTGDIARWTGEGTIEFRGRRDTQLKIRGNRIELGEIENVINRLPVVEKACVIVKDFGNGDRRLAAYYVLNSQMAKEQLLKEIKAELPDYMVPTYLIPMEKLPLNSNGKIDTKALPDPQVGGQEGVEKQQQPKNEVEVRLKKIWQEVLKTEEISTTDNFFMIGGDSLKAIRIANRIQEELGEIIHVAALFETPTITELAENIQKYKKVTTDSIDENQLEVFRELVKAPPLKNIPKQKNPSAVFILSAPRSGSTLLRSILGGHAELFSPPELELLNFEDLRQRKGEFSGKFGFYREGVIKALMEINQSSAEEANVLMERYESQNISTQEMYGILQKGIGKRLLVDKSPFYTLDKDVLDRAEMIFEDPKYIFLVRNPYGSVSSFEEAKIDQIFRKEHDYSVRKLAELIWTVSNTNIVNFLQNIPETRKHFVTYESIVKNPEATVRGICEFLNIKFEEGLVDLYDGKRARMMDGVYPESKTLGDIKILSHRQINSDHADRWKQRIKENFLSDVTIDLAVQLGFSGSVGNNNRIPVIDPAPHYEVSHAQKRLWILSQVKEASLAYNSPQSWVLDGSLDIAAFRKAFGTLVQRHEILRTVFTMLDDEPRQVVLEGNQEAFDTEFVDFSTAEDGYGKAEEMVKDESLTPFSLEEGPLIRSKLIRLEKERYIWSLNMHHIVCDAWSISNIFKEMLTLYNAYKHEQYIELSPLRIQYKDYAAWQNEQLISGAADHHKEYWHKKLGNDLPVMNFPTSFPRSAKRTYGGRYRSYDFTSKITQSVKQVASQNQCSLYIAMLSVIKVLIYKYSGQDDIVVGTSVAGREHQELEDQLGLYLNTLVMRTKISSGDNFVEVLDKVRETVEGAYQHQMYPFNKIVDELNVVRDPGRNPIIDIMVDMQSAKESPGEMDGLKISNYYKDAYYNKFDLVFNILETTEGLTLGIGYNTGLFSDDFIDEIGQSAKQLTENLTSNQFIAVGKHGILTQEEQSKLLSFTKGPEEIYPRDHILSVFNSCVVQHRENIAVVDEGVVYSYLELDRLSSQLCRYMQQVENVQPGQPVGVMMERSANLLVSMLAVLKAGGVYIPIDTDQPQSRKQHIMDDAGISMLLTETAYLLELSEHYGGGMFFIDSQMESLTAFSADTVIPDTDPLAPVYAIYTSGSTGVPKGVLVGGQSLLNLCYWHQQAFQVAPSSRATVYAGIAFDASIWEIWPYLLTGATLYPISTERRLDLPSLVDYIYDQKVTHCFFPTPVCEQISQLPELRMPDTITILTGGDRLHEIHFNDVHLVNNYGPTEGTVVSTSIPVAQGKHKGNVSIGRPIANTSAYILDADRCLLPEGVVGELYIAGAHLALGYLNNPELTAEKFIDNPFGKEGDRMYATGDLCKWGVEHQIFFTGRSDNQVKIRGYRIELGEIEAYLGKHPTIDHAYIQVLTTPSDKFLLGYYQSNREIPASELKAYMAKGLPSYMVPDHFIFLQEVPVTVNGKVDRSAFPLPDESSFVTQGVYEGPRTETEFALTTIWEETLGISPISIHANFFEIGGHSLKAVQMVSRIYKKMQRKIDFNVIFLNPTIEQLANEIDTLESQDFEAIPSIPHADHYPISHAQKRFWILDQNDENHLTYNMSEAYRLNGKLNVNAFKKAFRSLVDRHESLRSTISLIEGEPRQIVHGKGNHGFEVKYLDLRTSGDVDSQVTELAVKEASSPFDLTTGPLLRATLMQISEDQFVFVFTLHHIITDGWSMGVVLNDVLELYHAYDKGIAPKLKPMRIQYKDFAFWHNTQLQGDSVNSLRNYWLNQFSDGLPVLKLATDYERPLAKGNEGGMYTLSLSEELSAEIKSWGLKRNNSLFMSLAGLLYALLYKYTGQEDIVIGTPIAGRDHIDLEDQVGFFVNTLALRTRFKGDETYTDLQEKVAETVLKAYQHQFYPFDLLVDELGIPFDKSRAAFFDVLLILQNTEQRNNQGKELGGVEVSKFETNTVFSKYDLLFNFVEDGDTLVMSIVYDAQLFKDDTIKHMADNFSHLSKQLLTGSPSLSQAKLLVTEEEASEQEEFLKSMQNF